MPPIFGIINSKLQPLDPEGIYRMKGEVKYFKARKIDALEIPGGYLSAAFVKENPLVSVADTIAECGDHVVIADASLYKRQELLRKIEGSGDEKKEFWGDALLILKAWMKWGEDCIKHLYGDYTFVIFNKNTGNYYCGRDPLGVRPLFYSQDKNVFIFGSELRYVLAYYEKRPALQQEYLLDSLVTAKSTKDMTPFEHIYRLKPGHYLNHSNGIINLQECWKPDPKIAIRLSNEEEYIKMFRERLVSAINMRCSGVSHLGSELSGGLDSSAVTGIAAEYATGKDIHIVAFSNLFPANTDIKFKDEREYIACMRAFKSFDWIGIDRLDQSITELLRYTIDIQGCFVQQNFNIFNRGIFEAASEKKIQVLLSGFGGDEMISARTAITWNEFVKERQWKLLMDEIFYRGMTIKTILKPWLVSYRYLKSRLFRPKFSTGIFTAELLNRRFANLPLKPVFAQRHSLRMRYGKIHKIPRQESISGRQFHRIMLEHIPQHMEYCYTAAAQYGVEYRYPMLDTDLIETCLAFPPWVKQHHGISRYIFRQALKGFVPEEIWSRNNKSGSTIPHIYFSLLNEKDLILNFVNHCSGINYLEEIIDFSRFPLWYEKYAKRDKTELNYLSPGAFYTYLMIMLYFKEHG